MKQYIDMLNSVLLDDEEVREKVSHIARTREGVHLIEHRDSKIASTVGFFGQFLFKVNWGYVNRSQSVELIIPEIRLHRYESTWYKIQHYIEPDIKRFVLGDHLLGVLAIMNRLIEPASIVINCEDAKEKVIMAIYSNAIDTEPSNISFDKSAPAVSKSSTNLLSSSKAA
ncbi:TPA: hypothetical protein DDW69_01760 [candidate division CPR2 bacterium]|uniref:Uncharacterized protein n=1 Tax=candidate division CPR2 bacterium GW2011_GWC1_41_48 TaxID=1618344 RepID=A0A0G0W9W0_UNCC2|nr:MAG: hypothetical protein UT47_C0001G0155 [candidate division CPR2 bacterium GW2011_GWC2_39_35]KKR28564.1 MAG: hypothetical protein UT59_C0024G0008 [candidate division CPR2 bacterium GW2011_GWD1_39_7]KKR29419.1 MAG: hypothetical protein UT60_C0002G0010 [candidate division CPR2 bacterium GW2011_GWD2_39_7]KKS09750.1 MAG: hypothetical protein UU65_C0001G0155 [candidate division CPR2 bacterium GW2011_GWC1_41_48]OGB61009.1 MAG: hypothetical protein A2Y27_02915 [candidate division CPR2 bacterium G